MKTTILRRLGAVLLSAALCVAFVPTGMAQAKDAPPGVSRVMVHDPSILKADGTYYLFGSHLADAKSTDLMDWTQMNFDWNWREGDSWKNDSVYGEILKNLAEPFSWAGYDDGDCKDGGIGVWAPDAIYNPEYVWDDQSKGAYMLYYCTTSSWKRSCIGYAVSKTAEGPYKHVDTVIYSGFSKTKGVDPGLNGGKSDRDTKWDNDYLNLKELIADGTLTGISDKWFTSNGDWNEKYAPNAIDPTIFFGKDGKMYMCYGSWSGGLFILELDKATGAVKYPGADGTENTSGNFTDRYFGTHIAGGNHQSGEGCYILYDAESGYYYMYETYGYLHAEGGYNMRLFRSENVYGPYLDAAGNNAKDSSKDNDRYGIKLIGNYKFPGQPGYRAAGHNSALIDDDGQRYLFHHQRFESSGGHQVRVRQQFLNEDMWPVNAVYEYQGEEIAHYEDYEVVGSYDLINHGTATDGNMINAESLFLYEDGTVGGAMSGTWQKTSAAGKAYDYITLKLDGTEYKGFFFKQYNEDETPQKVMTFSAIGSNNACLWGSQATSRKPLKEALVYGFNFEKGASSGSVAPVKHSAKSDKAALVGDAELVADAERGNVLHVQNDENALLSNYLRLPANVFSEVTEDGFTVSMWVNAGADTSEKSALFEANTSEGKVTPPMTRISAGLAAEINANAQAKTEGLTLKRQEWHHIAYSVNPQGMKLYVDGKLSSALSADLSRCFDVSQDQCIRKASNVSLGSGLIYGTEDVRDVKYDDVAIYNVALSDSQVEEIYATDTLKETPDPEPETQVITAKAVVEKTFGDKPFVLGAKLKKGNGTLSFVSSAPKVAAVDRKTGKVTIKNTGIAKITVTASKTAEFKKQTKTVTVKVAPKKTALSSVKSKSAGKAVLTWKAASKASGYRIRYAANAKFKSAHTVLVSKASAKTKTISKLKSKKIYYFRIQPYKKVGDVKVFGAYSKEKHVKIK
ncbi:MAG: family 43 glycosylhydrolase [Lachnospiraceae bacterium]|nr:family 43 glycosylhydrolase [Lachnospiraceae bacterium]